ncbi:MAG: transporter substrate-binding domain-containing protein [Desulfobacterales bacterium]|nr:transporter substrate-binding domain-containing protein [Desulfobacterales bacterium]
MPSKLYTIIASLIIFLACRGDGENISKVSDNILPLPQDGKQINAMGDHDYPPFEYNDKNGNPSGFNIDILRSTAKAMNLNIHIKLGPWNEVRSKLENREIEIISGMFKTLERAKKVDFTIPHFISTYVIFTRIGSDIKSIEDLKGKTVLVQDGDLGHDFIQEHGTAGRILTKRELGQAFYSLSAGEGDCVIAAVMQGQIIMKKTGIRNLTYVTKPLLQRNYCIAVKKGEAELLAKLNEGLNILKSSGEYDRIYEKWFSVYEDKTLISNKYVKILIQILVVLLFITAGIYFWNISLKKKVREKEILFRTIFETSPYSIAVSRIDDGKYMMVNSAFEQLTGYNRSETEGKTPFELGLKLLEANPENVKVKLFSNGRIDNEKITIINKSGNERQGIFSAALIRLQKEECILGMIVDITETRKLEEQLRHSQKMEVVGQLAGGIAHDFNNMLAGIMGGTELLIMDLEPESNLFSYADMIMKSAERAAELINKLLAFSRIKSIVLKNIDIHDVILSTISILERTLEKSIEIRTALEADKTTVMGAETLLQNALMNLGLNARDAMPKGGVLSYSTRNITLKDKLPAETIRELGSSFYVEITISDTGEGISQDIINRIFEPFFTTKPVGKGTGLGLSAVYGTVKEHGGAINLSSEQGRGTVFRIYIPVHESFDTATVKDKTYSQEKKAKWRGSVLIIDDEPMVRNSTEIFLRKMGFTVFSAENGIKGIEIFKENRTEILFVILDMIMPGLSGQETCRILRSIDPSVKVIIASGFTRQNMVIDNSDENDIFFLQKPYRIEELEMLIIKAKIKPAEDH